MTTYPLATLAPTIDSTGISAPSYFDVWQSLIAIYQNIYGSDIYIAPDSQDGQWIAALAKAINDSNQSAVSVFNSFSPDFAQGAGLSSRVKLNGLNRLVATNSTAVGTVVGTAGYTILSGVVQDVNKNLWNLPTPLVIPLSGSIVVTVTAQNLGSTMANVGDISSIYNPQIGWQSFTNTAAASPGQPVEQDATLRQRQSGSVALPASGIKAAIYSAVGNVPGIGRFQVYENDTAATDVNGVPAHSICVVAEGGVAAAVAGAIASRKPPGTQTYGTTAVVVYDSIALPSTINFFVQADQQIYFDVAITALAGYVSTTGVALQQALMNFINALTTGEDVYAGQAWGVASLMGSSLGQTFKITSLKLGFTSLPTGVTDLVIAFNAGASCAATTNINLTVS